MCYVQQIKGRAQQSGMNTSISCLQTHFGYDDKCGLKVKKRKTVHHTNKQKGGGISISLLAPNKASSEQRKWLGPKKGNSLTTEKWVQHTWTYMHQTTEHQKQVKQKPHDAGKRAKRRNRRICFYSCWSTYSKRWNQTVSKVKEPPYPREYRCHVHNLYQGNHTGSQQPSQLARGLKAQWPQYYHFSNLKWEDNREIPSSLE